MKAHPVMVSLSNSNSPLLLSIHEVFAKSGGHVHTPSVGVKITKATVQLCTVNYLLLMCNL